MKLILHYLKRYKKLLILNMISVFGFALVELGLPTIIANMIDYGVSTQNQNYLYSMWFFAIFISLLGVAGTILLGYCCAKISTSITKDIRNDIFTKVQTFSPYEFNRFGISSLITRTNNDAFQIQMFINVILRTALLTPVMVVISFVMTLKTSLELSLIIAATLPIVVIGVIIVAKVSEPMSQKQQTSLDQLNRISRENLSGLKVIRAFGNDQYEQQRFNETNDVFTKYTKNIFKLMTLTQPVFYLLMNIATLLIFFVASQMINTGSLQVGKLVAFQDYLFHAMFSMMLFCSVFVMYPRAAVSAKRIQEVLTTKSHIQDVDCLDVPEVSQHSISFEHVTFAYPDSEIPVLKDISFQAKEGETVAFIGSTGSGKSTLINLIPRFYDITVGKIMIDGMDIQDYSMEALRNKIGFIPQKAMLFTGTIADNLRYGKSDASLDELKHAATVAQSYDFIMEKPQGFDEMITESATNVSGGQRQRLSIARAIIKKPEIYIFDDSFSALDFKTDAALRFALKQETKHSIVLIVAQRISTIMDADRIIVLDEGRIIGQGTHQELLKTCSIYHEIALSQLSEEELRYE
ncbi:ABC transporter ATP-binding protein [Candidatus Stoquefichus sp. SB1]|jgi:ATP-binding cassette subfamily B multidrug efflux pump|uniref:ABC transporter ATP-binding protein n=1 Tax=Candidatus Stoquefichus sp. SB1 TaxID=1658109 RepID=UPI00067F292B|nr:ABC transporter ATP-binding protein [Candidatus Stoquefichus sp. SB1]